MHTDKSTRAASPASKSQSYAEAYAHFEGAAPPDDTEQPSLFRPPALQTKDRSALERHSDTDSALKQSDWRPKFRPDSIFYEPSPPPSPNSTEPPYAYASDFSVSTIAPSAASRNDIFFQDFSAYPSSKEPSPRPLSGDSRSVSALQVEIPFDRPHDDILNQSALSRASSAHSSPSAVLLALTPTNSRPRRQRVLTPVLGRIAALKPSSAPLDLDENSIRVLVLPMLKNQIGEGRYAKVYRAHYIDVHKSPIQNHQRRFTEPALGFPLLVEEDAVSDGAAGDITCVVKYPHSGDLEAQTNAVSEAAAYREIKAWRHTVWHRNILRFIALQDDQNPDEPAIDPVASVDSRLRMVLEYCPNGTLHNYISENARHCGKRKWIHWCMQLASAVAFLHTGGTMNSDATTESNAGRSIIHRDIKPQNILLTDDLELKLSDFGSAFICESRSASLAFPGELGHGTQVYSAPESLSPPDFSFSQLTDIYAVGCTFYFMLTGREPFSDIRSPAQQLWFIRKGGANPLESVHFTMPMQPRRHVRHESQQDAPRSTQFVTTTTAVSAPPFPHQLESSLLKFLNGEVLLSTSNTDTAVYQSISQLLRTCLARSPQERPDALRIMSKLNRIDDSLLPGGGIPLPSPAHE